MSGPEGFDYRTRTNGEVHIFHHGKLATMLKNDEAAAFLDNVKDGDAQQVMADAVGHDGQHAKPGTGRGSAGKHLGGDGHAHAAQQFRRKSG